MADTTLHRPSLVYEKVRAGHWEIERQEIQILNKVRKRPSRAATHDQRVMKYLS